MPGGEPTTSQRSLPTLDKLNVQIPQNVDAISVATSWLQNFGQLVEAGNVAGAAALLVGDAFWRDMLALTWEFRTFEGTQAITQFLADQLPIVSFSKLVLKPETASLQQPYPDLAWVQTMFTFETKVGIGSGVIRLVPITSTASATRAEGWKAHTVYTNLEELKGFPERVGPLRDPLPNHGMWPEKRRREIAFEDREPTVIILGGGQSGLDVAARLQLMGVPTLIVEKNARIGDQWRGRYEALCLHDPVWYDHMPYIPFPASWPIWTPAPKLADWLESFANSMELNVWTSSTVEKLIQNPNKDGWTVIVKKADGTTRTFKPRHFVFALGLGGGLPNMPTFAGADKFEGKLIHSSQHGSAREHKGKKVVVIGACTSGHDIAHDHYTHGVDVTIYQRSSTYIMSNKEGMPRLMGGLYWEGGPPTDVADRINASFPNNLIRLMHQRVTADIAAADKELLDGLNKRGFRTNLGKEGSGFLLLAWERAGGYYLDVGASQLIVDGKIKLKNDSQISHFSKNSIVFEDESELPADVVICATGYGDQKVLVEKIAGPEVANALEPVWGLNKEGEVNGVWRWSGVPNLYFMQGNLALCRFHSTHLALNIKAIEEGIHGPRYTK